MTHFPDPQFPCNGFQPKRLTPWAFPLPPADRTSNDKSFTTGIAAKALSAAPTPPFPPSSRSPPPPAPSAPAVLPLALDESPQFCNDFRADASPRTARSRSVLTPLDRRRAACVGPTPGSWSKVSALSHAAWGCQIRAPSEWKARSRCSSITR